MAEDKFSAGAGQKVQGSPDPVRNSGKVIDSPKQTPNADLKSSK